MSKLFHKDKPIIGLDINQTGIKIMSVNSKRWQVTGYGSVDLDPVKVQKSLDEGDGYLSDNIQALVKNKIVGSLPSRQVVLGIPTGRTFSRTFTLPVKAENTLKEAVVIEAEQYIPVPVNLLYLDWDIIGRDKENITVVMSAVPKKLVDSTIQAAKNAGLEVEMVEPGMNAIARVLQATEDAHLPTAIIDIGPANTDIAVLEGGVIRVTGGIGIGSNTFTLDIAKKLGVSLENAHQLKVLNGMSVSPRQKKITAALKPSLERIVTETRKVIRYYTERLNDEHKIEQILIVGGGSNIPGIGDYFTNELVMPARVAVPWQKLDFGTLPQPSKQFRPRYVTVAGLASVPEGSIWS